MLLSRSQIIDDIKDSSINDISDSVSNSLDSIINEIDDALYEIEYEDYETAKETLNNIIGSIS